MEFRLITWNWNSNKFYKAIIIGVDQYLESGMNWNRYKNIDQNRKVWNFWSNPNFAIEGMEFQVITWNWNSNKFSKPCF